MKRLHNGKRFCPVLWHQESSKKLICFRRSYDHSLRASSPIWASEPSLARTRERGAEEKPFPCSSQLRRLLARSREIRFTRQIGELARRLLWSLFSLQVIVSRKKPGLFNLRGYHFFEVCSDIFIFLRTQNFLRSTLHFYRPCLRENKTC